MVRPPRCLRDRRAFFFSRAPRLSTRFARAQVVSFLMSTAPNPSHNVSRENAVQLGLKTQTQLACNQAQLAHLPNTSTSPLFHNSTLFSNTHNLSPPASHLFLLIHLHHFKHISQLCINTTIILFQLFLHTAILPLNSASACYQPTAYHIAAQPTFFYHYTSLSAIAYLSALLLHHSPISCCLSAFCLPAFHSLFSLNLP